MLILCMSPAAFWCSYIVSEYLLTQESCTAASLLPEVLDSQKQLNLSEVMDDSKSLQGGGPKTETQLKKGGEDCSYAVILHISRRTLGIFPAIWKIKKQSQRKSRRRFRTSCNNLSGILKTPERSSVGHPPPWKRAPHISMLVIIKYK